MVTFSLGLQSSFRLVGIEVDTKIFVVITIHINEGLGL